MDSRKATTITTKLAIEWATLPLDRHASWALRLTDVEYARLIARDKFAKRLTPFGIAATGTQDQVAVSRRSHG